MNGFCQVLRIVSLVSLMVGGMSPLVWSDPGSGHDPHGTTPPKGMGYGGGAQEGMRHHGGFLPLALKEQLDLSDAQVNRLRPLEMEYRKSMIKNGADVRVEMVDLGTLMDAKDVDMGGITAKVDEIGVLQKNLMMFRVKTLLQVKEVLTSAQYAQFRSRLQGQMEGMSHHRGQMKEGRKHYGQNSGTSHGSGHGSVDGMKNPHP
ncbi:MAG: Spy/CpxP family protein refolding chaperone [Nitrospirales bacterium]